MVGPVRISTTIAIVVCVFTSQLSTATLFAAEDEPASAPVVRAVSTHSSSIFDPTSPATGVQTAIAHPFLVPEFAVSSAQVYRGAPYPYPRRHDGAVAALMIGAAATITGTALLVYANRPDCSIAPAPGGCGYGMKVVGASVLSGGLVGLAVGALTWR